MLGVQNVIDGSLQIKINYFFRIIQAEYGNIVMVPAMFGRPRNVFAFNVEDYEKVFRFEGQFPVRRSLDTLAYYRKNLRPDIYGEYGSLITE